MLAVIDIGNTNVVIGLFEGAQLLTFARLQTSRQGSVDEWGLATQQFLEQRGYAPTDLNGAIISSVVPPLGKVFAQMISSYFGLQALLVDSTIQHNLTLGYEDARQLGADRLVNVVAAWHLYGGPAIVIDFGTATKFEALTEQGEYLGGAIAPGLKVGAEALFQNTSRLYRIELAPPRQAIGRNIVSSMQAGIMLGYIGLVEGMVRRFRQELSLRTSSNQPIKVIATGGLASLVIQDKTALIDIIDPNLTLQGLRLLYEMNSPLYP